MKVLPIPKIDKSILTTKLSDFIKHYESTFEFTGRQLKLENTNLSNGQINDIRNMLNDSIDVDLIASRNPGTGEYMVEIFVNKYSVGCITEALMSLPQKFHVSFNHSGYFECKGMDETIGVVNHIINSKEGIKMDENSIIRAIILEEQKGTHTLKVNYSFDDVFVSIRDNQMQINENNSKKMKKFSVKDNGNEMTA